MFKFIKKIFKKTNSKAVSTRYKDNSYGACQRAGRVQRIDGGYKKVRGVQSFGGACQCGGGVKRIDGGTCQRIGGVQRIDGGYQKVGGVQRATGVCQLIGGLRRIGK